MSNPDVLDKYQSRFKYIMVDEYQDTNVTQYLLIRLLCQNTATFAASATTTSLFILGAAPKLKIFCASTKTLRMQKPFAWNATTALPQTFSAAASCLISHNEGRLGKTLKVAENSPAQKADNAKIKVVSTYNGEEEAQFVVDEVSSLVRDGYQYSDMAVLVRTAAKPVNLKKSLFQKPSLIRLSAASNSMNGPKSATRWLISGWSCSLTTTWR